MVENVLVGFEDPVGQPVVAHELPEVLSGIELGAFGRQCQQRDVGGNSVPRRHVPASLIEEQHGVAAGCHFGKDFGKVQVDRLDVAGWQDKCGTLSIVRANGAEDVSGCYPLIFWRSLPRLAHDDEALPKACDIPLLAIGGSPCPH